MNKSKHFYFVLYLNNYQHHHLLNVSPRSLFNARLTSLREYHEEILVTWFK